MTQSVSFADRLADKSLRLLGIFNLLALAGFYLGLLLAVAHAETEKYPACSGENMLEAMERDRPDELRRIREEAASVANGGALLWRIEKAGIAPSYLFGTMHLSDPRVVQLPAAAGEAFEGAKTIVIETTDILDQSKMMEAMAQRPELMMFTDGTSLFSLLNEADRQAVEKALAARNIPPSSVARMKPWMLATILALPRCELARKAAGEPVLDAKLAQDALADGKQLGGLETAIDQLEAMASLPMDFHLRGLVETLELGDRVEDVMETMVQLYLNGETAAFWPFFRVALPEQAGIDGGFADFEERLIIARNHTMAQNAVPFIERGAAFIAVGAMHLPGEEGLISLLRQAGFQVEKVDATPIVGADLDDHGCKRSAGYQWCEKTGRCERPWELAQAQGFETSAEAYAEFCSSK